MPGFGLSCDQRSVDSLVVALRWFVDNREATRMMGVRGQEQIRETWNYEAGFGSVIDTLTAGVA